MDDLSIIDKVKQDSENFRLLVKKYQEIILNYLYGWTWDKSLAEDLTQETFVSLFENLGKYDRTKSLKAWLLTIARNKLIDHFRKHKGRKEVPLDEEVTSEEEPLIEERVLKDILDRMDEKYKEVF